MRWHLLYTKHKYHSDKMGEVFGIKELYHPSQEPEVEQVTPGIPTRS